MLCNKSPPVTDHKKGDWISTLRFKKKNKSSPRVALGWTQPLPLHLTRIYSPDQGTEKRGPLPVLDAKTWPRLFPPIFGLFVFFLFPPDGSRAAPRFFFQVKTQHRPAWPPARLSCCSPHPAFSRRAPPSGSPRPPARAARVPAPGPAEAALGGGDGDPFGSPLPAQEWRNYS